MRSHAQQAQARSNLLISRARGMLHAPTPSEAALWQALRGGALGVAFKRQVPLGDHYIADFLKKPKPHLVAAAMATDSRSASEKLRLLIEAGSLSEEQLGEFLRREGLRDGDLERFRAEALGGLEGKVRSPQDLRQIQELERQNAKQAKRLHEAEVLLELQKKVHELWGAKDDDTTKG